MKHLRAAIYSVIIALFVYGIATWPLPKYFSSGIAMSHRDAEGGARAMVPGDHLQFLYHVWLAQDTFFGETPLFHNIYEFNLGEDDELKNTAMRYYLPFSLFFSLGATGGNQALGWNFMGLVSLWLTLLGTYLLVRRYTDREFLALLASCMSIAFPYRIFTLLSGSPTGLAMMWIPFVYLGLDVMVRDRRMWGAVLAGASIVLSRWCDLHVIFFAALTTPFWCLFAYIYDRGVHLVPTWEESKRYLLAASPLFFFVLLIGLQMKMASDGLETTELEGGMRRISEVAINSPRIGDLISLEFSGVGNHVYIGWATIVIVLLSYLAIISRSHRSEHANMRNVLTATLLLLAMLAIAVLALGVNMPGGASAWRLLCKIVPPYGKIRQPAKIFSILPTMLSVFFVLGLPSLLSIIKKRYLQTLFCSVVFVLMFADYAAFTRPAICKLDSEQGAYAAIAEDASKRGVQPHMLAIPLWPGNSHWTSINQYYVSLYRIRMVNGYAATPERAYQQAIQPFVRFNNGDFGDEQLDELLSRGVEYLLIHEDAFPEKVSQFPVAHTLNALLVHPRIEMIGKDRDAWAFRINEEGEGGVHEQLPGSGYRFPSRLWQAERSEMRHGKVLDDPNSSANRYLSLSNSLSNVEFPSYSFSWSSNLCYMVRLRGDSGSKASVFMDDKILVGETVIPASPEGWTWHGVEIPQFDGYKSLNIELSPDGAGLDVDIAILATSDWDPNNFIQPRIASAPAFFHAGYTDLETGDVVLEPDRVPAAAVFYGPKLPLPIGDYEVKLKFDTPAPKGTELGVLRSKCTHGMADPIDVVAGESAVMEYSQESNLRMTLEFVYSRAAKLVINELVITPKEKR